ncbi:MAG: transcriptional regulator [Lachnospiraceae bacterium]|nr:transcriptional regulator [Lachnospiraceae bacterium]
MFFFFNDKVREADMLSVLSDLISNWEDEVVEFKEAGKDYDKDKIGKYFSAISNEANLKGLQFGWLVFGVKNKTREIVGSDYRNTKGLNTLKQEIAVGTTGGISFIEIIEIYPIIHGEEKRVIMFQIPAAVTATPTGWHDHFYGRNGESLSALSVEELDRIRGQEKKDWSKQFIDGASIRFLNKAALNLAREKYKEKMNRPYITKEVDRMTDEEFLTKLKLMQNGRLTNAAMLLLGDEDYDYLFATAPEASWRLFNYKNDIQDYEIFKIPFLTLSERVFPKIRNLTYRYMPNQLTLFPTETKQYDMWLLRELMNNCIVHSDYSLGGRIYLNEFDDYIILTNPGTFLPGSVEPILKASYNPPFYRNQLLAETMVKLNMIDTQTMGIRRVFRIQQEKYFPLPDYDLSVQRQVKVTVYGKVLDENYTQVLFQNPDFDLATVYLMDRVQKHESISKDAVKHLRKLKIIEGKIPNIYISSSLAVNEEEKAQYVKNKGFNEEAYKKWIVNYLKTYKAGQKKDFLVLLRDKLPDTMDEKQKLIKVQNLLQSLRKDGVITLDSDNLRTGKWVLAESNSGENRN